MLKRQPVFEADCLFTILTREQGRLLVKGRGVLKPLSKLSGGLLTAAHSRLRLTEGTIPTVTSAAPVRVFGALMESPEKARLAWTALEAVLRSTVEARPEPVLFDLLLRFLENLDGAQEADENLVKVFLYQQCEILGYGMPEPHERLSFSDVLHAFEYNFERKLLTLDTI